MALAAKVITPNPRESANQLLGVCVLVARVQSR